MELRDYLKTLDVHALEQFAVSVGTTVGHLRNVAYGQRIASAALAAQIEIKTDGKVPVAVLRPADWHLIWDPRRHQLVDAGAIVIQNGLPPSDQAPALVEPQPAAEEARDAA